ncbi:hypothetical protein AN161_11825 [Lysinibacillus sp. FJAT-14222]|nr:hypothetical protein AN161_11825 [Lysinibacillus sp. FJAT-14222]
MIEVCHNEKFSDLNDRGQEILNLFDTIEPKLNEVLELVEQQKDKYTYLNENSIIWHFLFYKKIVLYGKEDKKYFFTANHRGVFYR